MIVRMQAVEPWENMRRIRQRLSSDVVEGGGYTIGVDLVNRVRAGLKAGKVVRGEEKGGR